MDENRGGIVKETGSTRRQVLGLAAGSIAASCAFVGPLSAAAARLTIPNQPMILTRGLSRSLRDGKAIVVKRSWQVTFAKQARGFAISGKQVAVSVDAPPALASLTAIEEGRSTAAMFPILLSPDGKIMAVGPETSAQSLAAAITKADALIASSNLSTGALKDYQQFTAELQRTGGAMLDQMPGDLFYPSTKPLREVRSVPLPDGNSGEFELSWEASVQPQTSLLASARREVITRIGDTARTSWEEWTLAPA